MTDENYRLSSHDKQAIFDAFAHQYGVTLNNGLCNKNKDVDPPHGFPHCVEMFCTNKFLRQNGLYFFDNPEDFIKTELHNFKDNDSFKFLVLILVLYKENQIHASYLRLMPIRTRKSYPEALEFHCLHHIMAF